LNPGVSSPTTGNQEKKHTYLARERGNSEWSDSEGKILESEEGKLEDAYHQH
jgi:hypothetical protein